MSSRTREIDRILDFAPAQPHSISDRHAFRLTEVTMAPFRYALLIVLATSSFAPTIAGGQDRWTVTIVTASSIPIGQCSAVGLEIRDVETRDVPRNPNGDRVTVADFDVTMSAETVAPEYLDAYHVRACVCQGATVGSSATVTAVYPASVLPASTRVTGVSARGSTTFLVGKPDNKVNPPACTTPGVAPRTAVVIAAMKQTVATTTTRTTTSLAPAPIPIPVTTAPAPLAVPMPDSPLPTTTSDGKVGVVPPPPSPALVPINPVGFSAVQTGPGLVQLSWQQVDEASYYVLFGPGLAEGGARVPAVGLASSLTIPVVMVRFTATDVPAGLREWKVASYYEPGPVSTAASAFPSATLNVIGPVAVNPVGFTAVQTGAGLVKLSWQPATGATYYIVRGPGLPDGEVKLQPNSSAGAIAVGGTPIDQSLQLTASAVPSGIQKWTVASYFYPGPVSTPANEFPKAFLSVAPPANPSAFTATQLAGRQVKFSWQQVSEASYYILMGTGLPSGGTRVTLAPGGYGSTQAGYIPLVTFTANSIPTGSGVWQVGAFFEPGPVSSAVSAFTKVALTVVEPTNPAGFAATQVGTGKVKLSWLPVAGASFYVVTGTGLPSAGARVGTAVSGDTAKFSAVEFTVSAIPTGLGTWQVGSYFDPGAVASPPALFPEVTLNVAAPTNPSGFTATQVGAGKVKFSWRPVPGASYYVVMGTGLPSGGTRPGTGGGGAATSGAIALETFTATGIPAGPGVWQIGSFFEPGPLSTPVSEFSKASLMVAEPTNPSDFAATQIAPGQVKLSWLPVIGASYYVVTGSGLPFAGARVGTAVSGVMTKLAKVEFIVSALPTGPSTWQVGSYFDPGALSSREELFSQVALNVAPPLNPVGLSATQIGAGQVRIRWQPVDGAAYYIVTGTGLPASGTKVVGEAGASNSTGILATIGLTVSGLPLGLGTWQVGSYFEPGPVASASDAFSRISLNVAAPMK